MVLLTSRKTMFDTTVIPIKLLMVGPHVLTGKAKSHYNLIVEWDLIFKNIYKYILRMLWKILENKEKL